MKKCLLLWIVLLMNCIAISTYAINTIDSVVATSASCVGLNDGSISILNQSFSAPVQYSLNGSALQSSPVFTGLTPGVYTLLAIDSISNADTATVTVNNAIGFLQTFNVLGTSPNCTNTIDGSLVVVASGSLNNVWFEWSNNALNNSRFNTNINSGTYWVKIKDSSTQACAYLQKTLSAIGTNCGNIIGRVIADTNQNCTFNSWEKGIANKKITLSPGGDFTFTNEQGEYRFEGKAFGIYTVNNNNILGYSNGCINNIITTLNAGNATATINFFDTLTNQLDYQINSFSNCLNYAQGNTQQRIHYRKAGGSISYASIYAVFDSIQHFSSSTPPPFYISNDTVFWNIVTTNSDSDLVMQYNVQSTTPIGTNYHVKIGFLNYAGVDADTTNNMVEVISTVCPSTNNNQKNGMPTGKLPQGYIPLDTKKMNYNIGIQNTSGAEIVHGFIVDTVHKNLDINTLQVTSASAPYYINILQDSILVVSFPLIMLEDSAINQSNSKANIAYTISIKTSVQNADQILNRANIYLDSNLQSSTNMVINTLFAKLLNPSNNVTRNTSCNLACGNGSINTIIIGGVPPYSMAIFPTCTNTSLIGNTFSNLPANNYTINAIDAIGNTTSVTVTVLNPVPIILNLTVTQPQGQAGGASVAPTGGTPPYDYLWTPSNATTPFISNIPQGNYSISIVDAQGCSQGGSFVLNFPTDINNDAGKNQINIFPNPATNHVQLTTTFMMQQIELINELGQIVFTKNNVQAFKFALPTDGFAKGIYYLRINNLIVHKLVIQ
jgi:Secretion system C-terminal sorting domain/SprB repeat